MDRYRVNISDPAEQDLYDIVRYISAQLDAPVTALNMMNEIEKAVDGLSNMPSKYQIVRDERLAAMGYCHKNNC